MSNDRTSIIIPSCKERFLQKTIDCIIDAAKGDIEIIVALDGFWPDPPLKDDDRITMLHTVRREGMRPAIKKALRIATGKYIMKCDAHCSFDKGFDEKLKADCELDWICIPSRYSLDADTWEKTRGPVDYLYLSFPYTDDPTYGGGFHGKKWKGLGGDEGDFFFLEKKMENVKIDDIIAFQGSCFFTHKEHLLKIGYPDTENYGYCGNEAQELSFKTWLSGGRVIRNKNTWYGHLHKCKENGGRGFFINRKEKDKSTEFSAHHWMNNQWPGQIHDLKWLIDKFQPMDGWPEGWNEREFPKFKLKGGKIA